MASQMKDALRRLEEAKEGKLLPSERATVGKPKAPRQPPRLQRIRSSPRIPYSVTWPIAHSGVDGM
jgi:hypothetical protein